MKTAKISLNSIDKVKAFVNEISKFDCDFDLVSGRYVIDAKSTGKYKDGTAKASGRSSKYSAALLSALFWIYRTTEAKLCSSSIVIPDSIAHLL